MIKTTNQLKFLEVYKKNLRDCIKENPDNYRINESNVEDFGERFIIGFMKFKSSKDGMAVKRTCKELGIGYTYKAIEEYLGVR